MTSLDHRSVRPLFDLPDHIAYMACAAQMALPKAAHAAGLTALERKQRPWDIPRLPDLGEVAERCRGLFGGLIGATADDIAIVPASSYGVATAAANLPLRRGQAVLVLEGQYPSDYYSWRHKTADAGATLKTVPRPADGDWTAAALAALTPEVAIAALPPTHWTDGGCLDLVALGAACRRQGTALVVDATQVAGAAPFDVPAVQPDFLVASGYKWLLCPYTLSFLYVAPHRHEGRPLEDNPGGRAGWEGYHDGYAPGARRYDMGEKLAHVNLPMAEVGLSLLASWGPAAVTAGIAPMIDRAAALAEERGWRVPPAAHRVKHYIGVRRATPFKPDAEARLAAQDLHVSARGGGLRIAPYLFGRLEEIDRLFAALDRLD